MFVNEAEMMSIVSKIENFHDYGGKIYWIFLLGLVLQTYINLVVERHKIQISEVISKSFEELYRIYEILKNKILEFQEFLGVFKNF
jgi:hypothetical protein